MTEPTHTRAEIMQQPAIWRDMAQTLPEQVAGIRDWIAARDPGQIWLAGAGSSAFVGEVVARAIAGGRPVSALPTTDLVASPGLALHRPGRALVVQFGRSGDSSESVAVLDLLDRHRPDLDRLHVTCNPASALATREGLGPGQTRALILPEATHDRGFAMTSSFTSMLIAALAVFDDGLDVAGALPRLADSASRLLTDLWTRPAPRPDRAVFLGSGALTGIARESALKVLELTAGATMTQWDSSLGFRHGPKAGVDAHTSVFVMIHPDPQTARYDIDLADEIRHQFPRIAVVTLGGAGADIAFDLTSSSADAALYVLPAQVLAHRWSQDLGLAVDDPFAGRNLTRVVAGVRIHGWVP
ncbi:SIS domain-containing protein [Paracoccus sp. p4-l81]|uniref:SIS domain-containing protein n=1 Tax=Paracoccus sp. p4-l81 TaxID=3342806 RepID=UPI0035B6E987